MRDKRNKSILGLFLVVCPSVVAFQAPAAPRPSIGFDRMVPHNGNSRLRVGKTMPFDGTNIHHSEILVGNSPKVIKLRQALKEIWTSPKTCPIIIIGPRGSGKGSIVEELLDRLPVAQTENIHRLPMDEAVSHIDTMVGSESHAGLLDLLADQNNTTLVLTSFQTHSVRSADEFGRREEFFQTIAKLVTDRTFYSRFEGKEKPFAPRIIATCSHEPDFAKSADVFLVKIPSLESRTQDMEAIATAKINVFETNYGLENVQMSLEATHRLLDHPWDMGESELDNELRSALELLATEKQHTPGTPSLLKSKHMLVKTWNESMRHRLLYEFPILRDIIHSPWVFDHTLRYIVTPVFILVLAALFLGPQTRDHNAALTVFWAGWWPAVMLSYPFLGRIWCSICPFMAVGNWAQEAVTQIGGVKLQKKWPKWVDNYGSAFAFGLFFAILMWEELWNLPQNGALSAWLLLLITSGAVFNSVQYEKRMWCRHLCPIGAMCRTFGTMSILEVRSFKSNCHGCTNPQCVKGMSPAVEPTDTFALKGCTMDLKNNQLRDMGHCTLCMSCVKNCEREVPEVNARPIGLDYGLPWLVPSPFQDPKNLALSQVETNFWMGALLTVLQGSVLVHYMPTILSDLGMDPTIATATPALDLPFLTHSIITVGLLALPGMLSLAADRLSIPLEHFVKSLRSHWGKGADAVVKRRIVIDIYETIMKSDKPIKETLREFDPDGDGMITCWECKRALGHLNLPEHQCETLMGLMKRRVGDRQTIPIETWLDNFQQIYLDARQRELGIAEKQQESRLMDLGNALQTKKTFVEIFDELDEDNDGFISKEDFGSLLDKNKISLTDQEKQEVFTNADLVEDGRLNLFEFMSMMRKIVRVGIQEIGYGYLPLAWASLTAYWLSIGLKELGFTLARLPDTFFMNHFVTLPSIVASDELVETVQAVLLLSAIPPSIGLTQKLCDDNKIGGIRFGLHAAIQVVGAWATLYLMLSPSPLLT